MSFCKESWRRWLSSYGIIGASALLLLGSQQCSQLKVYVSAANPNHWPTAAYAQACSFRDSYEDFCKVGATVVGVSKGDAASHQTFRKKHNLPFMLLCDEEDKVSFDEVPVMHDSMSLSSACWSPVALRTVRTLVLWDVVECNCQSLLDMKALCCVQSVCS